jgi:CDP-diacylglycerol pyrophosphatase
MIHESCLERTRSKYVKVQRTQFQNQWTPLFVLSFEKFSFQAFKSFLFFQFF